MATGGSSKVTRCSRDVLRGIRTPLDLVVFRASQGAVRHITCSAEWSRPIQGSLGRWGIIRAVSYEIGARPASAICLAKKGKQLVSFFMVI